MEKEGIRRNKTLKKIKNKKTFFIFLAIAV